MTDSIFDEAVVKILLYIYNKGGVVVAHTYIMRDTGLGSGTVYRARKTLKKLGLIEEKYLIGRVAQIQLTESGMKVAKLIKEINKTIQESKNQLPQSES